MSPIVLRRCGICVVLLGLAATASAQLRLVPFVSGLSAPLEFVQDPSSPAVQYVVQQGGVIRVVQSGVLLPTPFLDVTSFITSGGERGLLGLAFPLDYAASGRFFVNFTNLNGDTVVARFQRSAANAMVADPTTRFDLRWGGTQRFISQPFPNHNGGHLVFGPDGYLYVALGDGGSGDDPYNNSQSPSTLLGKLLRIDVSVADTDPNGYQVPGDNPFVGGLPVPALPEIWAFGVRNPWKFSFDDPAHGGSGAMLIGDVGQGSYEEVDYQPPGVGGRNYGWHVREGTHAHIASAPAYTPLIDPVTEYDHSVGSSITGGFVYRGVALGATYRGRYFFADFVAGRIFSTSLFPIGGGEAGATPPIEHTAELGGSGAIGNVSAFGVDAAGELYVVSYSLGTIFKVVDSQPHRMTGTSDFDGDGKADIAVWRPSSGVWYVVKSSDGAVIGTQWGAGYSPYNDVPVPGDYDGDGRIDAAVWRSSIGVWFVVRSSDGGWMGVQLGATGDQPIPGDYDGDGRTDFAVWHPTTGVWDVMQSSSGAVVSTQWGAGYSPYNDVPVPADYDGDRVTDMAVWRASDGIWYIIRSSDRSVVGRQWGAGYAPYNDRPVPGDYDGDGKADLAVWRPAIGVWFVILSSDGSVFARQWGAGYAPYNDVPVPADYDGDSITDTAVWRSSTGTWYVIRSSDGGAVGQQWGEGTDYPVPKSH